MSDNARDTQFLESAKAQWARMEKLLDIVDMRVFKEDIEKFLAQYAYDIATHTLFENSTGIERLSTEWIWERVQSIPDLSPEWWKYYEKKEQK